MVTRSADPPPHPPWSGKPPPSVVWVVVGSIRNLPPLPSLPFGVGSCKWESLSLFPRPCILGVCGVEFVLVSLGEVESVVLLKVESVVLLKWGLLVLVNHQTIFCRRRFCSETLGCPFRRFGRPWGFLLGTIQYRAIKSVLMT